MSGHRLGLGRLRCLPSSQTPVNHSTCVGLQKKKSHRGKGGYERLWLLKQCLLGVNRACVRWQQRQRTVIMAQTAWGCWEWCMLRPENKVTLLSNCKAPTFTVTGTTAHSMCDKINSLSPWQWWLNLCNLLLRLCSIMTKKRWKTGHMQQHVEAHYYSWATLFYFTSAKKVTWENTHCSHPPAWHIEQRCRLSKQSAVSRWTWFFSGPFPADISTGLFHLEYKWLVPLTVYNDEMKALRDV